jgi:hypothetical protein
MRALVSLCWISFSQKVGSGLISINKEASMQLQYAFILQQAIPLITYSENEVFGVELETGVALDGGYKEVDLVFAHLGSDESHTIAVEMKCYRDLASSGGKRGATDIFMKDVYEDLRLLERYVESGSANAGIELVMTDLRRLVAPKAKRGKAWDYDISDGSTFGPCVKTTPIGGREVKLELKRQYSLEWTQVGDFWFLETEGQSVGA